MPFANYTGGRVRHWTRERTIEGLRAAAAELPRPLPANDHAYIKLKKGRLDWPTYHRISEYFGSLAAGWQAAGVPRAEIRWVSRPWTKREDQYLLEWAGTRRLTRIAKDLDRTYAAVRARFGSKGFGLSARWNQGYMSAANVAAAYDTSYSRVLDLIADGVIEARRHGFRQQWVIAPEAITPEIEAVLRVPRKTHVRMPLDKGDYRKRLGIYRTRIDGRTVYVREDGGEHVPLIRPWTDEEEWYLVTHPNVAAAAEHLKRTPAAVRTRRSMLLHKGRVTSQRRRKPTLLDEMTAVGITAVVCFSCNHISAIGEPHKCRAAQEESRAETQAVEPHQPAREVAVRRGAGKRLPVPSGA